jgi:hypothetical protein
MTLLPDDVLLEIFELIVFSSRRKNEDRGMAIAGFMCVNDAWRNLVFRSPRRRLNLQLHRTHETPASHTLDVWPALSMPLLVEGVMHGLNIRHCSAGAEQSRTVCQVTLAALANRQLAKVFAAMLLQVGSIQFPCPELTDLLICASSQVLVMKHHQCCHSRFVLGWICQTSANAHFVWHSISGIGKTTFVCSPPTLPVYVYLILPGINIPHSGYISPEAIYAILMVALLYALSESS